MSPMLETMLIEDVIPRLRHAAKIAPKIGSDDAEEVEQDMTLMAIRLMVAAEEAGKSFTPGTIAYYTNLAAKSGRRSYSSGRCDVLSVGAQIAGNARLESFDHDGVDFDNGETGSLHDVVIPLEFDGQEPDPSEEAARNLDWESFLAAHSPRHNIAIRVLADGGTMRLAGRHCGLRDSAALNLKRKIATDLIEFFGEDTIRALLNGKKRPDWESGLRLSRERHLCHVASGSHAERHVRR